MIITKMQTLEKKSKKFKDYKPDEKEKEVASYLEKRLPIIKKSKTNILRGVNFEDIMKEADKEYQPNFLTKGISNRTSHFVQDDVTGLRGSRAVSLTGQEGQEWRSNISEPTLLVKIQTALSILVDQNPEAFFRPLLEKYEASNNIAKALWKRNWEIARSKEQLKLFIFDLAKYGWAIGRTYPRIVKRDAEVLDEVDTEKPENNKYKDVEIVEYNDVYREKLDPYRTWIDDKTNLTDPFSMDDWYFEKDYSQDDFDREFGMYSNAKSVKASTKPQSDTSVEDDINNETKSRDDIITVGFYESKNKDLYAVWAPNDKVVIFCSPLPNDQKKLTCWHTNWMIRDPRTPYGIGLYEVLKQDKVMYDRFMNMTIDQLVLAIYPMLFYSGVNGQVGDGTLTVSPGIIKQKLPGTSIDQVKIDFDPRGFDGIRFMSERMDDNTGITPTLQGEIEGQTLGETLHAKDSALKRLSIPMGNIAQAITDDAYITLSWFNQVYSLPDVKTFTNIEDLEAFELESGKKSASKEVNEETGEIEAEYYPAFELSLEEDKDGNLVESPETRYFTVGVDIPVKNIRWEGRITISAKSIIAPSPELDRQRKLELFNLLMPIVTQMAQMYPVQPRVALALAKPVYQILEIQDEKPENWLPDEIVEAMENPEIIDQMEAEQAQAEEQAMAAEQESAPENQLFVPAGGGAPSQNAQEAQTVVPRGETTNPLRKTVGEIGKVRT